MDPKTEAKQRRDAADLLDQVADKFQPLSIDTAECFRLDARMVRRRADELDPPQPEWQDGDLARDRYGNLWQFSRRKWWRRGLSVSFDMTILNYGPLTRVLTYDPAKQRITDPAKQEVVISLDGIDRRIVDAYFEVDHDQEVSTAGRVAHLAAKAAREQLGEVQ